MTTAQAVRSRNKQIYSSLGPKGSDPEYKKVVTVTQKAREYEDLVKCLLQTRLSHDSLIIPQIHSRKHYKGASGQEYEVDLSFETVLAETKILVLVECKCYQRSVGIDDLLEFAYKLRDIGGHKGIVVTTAGFESGAVTIAKREGIALLQLVRFKEEEVDEPLRAQNILFQRSDYKMSLASWLFVAYTVGRGEIAFRPALDEANIAFTDVMHAAKDFFSKCESPDDFLLFAKLTSKENPR